ncbi:MAG TPA: hypothetical protein VGX23_33645 [Actinocrinis sp.]|nr:hypothetical protein [Actinocrinis sp.]
MPTNNRRDVHIIYTDGRTDTFTGVREEVSRELEDLPFNERSGVSSSSSVPTRSTRRD